MREKNMTFRREELEKLSTLELDTLLRKELDSDTPERETVLLVLSILEDRDPTDSDNRPAGAEEAWERLLNRPRQADSKMPKLGRKPAKWLGAVAAAVLAIVLLVTVPQSVGAENIFQIIGRWTRDIFNLSDGSARQVQDDYVFQTDHEGLQQLYDAVVAQGITEPVVPMWIPEGYELKELKVYSHQIAPKICAQFFSENNYIQIVFEIHSQEETNKYPKDDTDVEEYEYKGYCYYIVSNEDTWKAIWYSGNTECAIFTNGTEDILYQVLNSISGGKNEEITSNNKCDDSSLNVACYALPC